MPSKLSPKTKYAKLGERAKYKTQCLRCRVQNKLTLYDGIYHMTVRSIGIRTNDVWQDFSPVALTAGHGPIRL